MTSTKIWAFVALVSLSIFASCEKDEMKPKQPDNTGDTTDTVMMTPSKTYVVNEGGFLKNNGSISTLSDGMASNNLFLTANGVGPGDVIQHMGFTNNNAYIVANNSQVVEVVTKSDFKSVASISDATLLDYPRYAQGVGNKVYISNGRNAGNLAVIDASNNNILTSINVGIAPERMLTIGNKLFVLNTGGFATAGDTSSIQNGSLSVINTDTDTEIKRTELFPRAIDIVADANNNVFVLCSGTSVFSADFTEIIKQTPPYLVQINNSGDVITSTKIGANSDKPSQLEIGSDGTLYAYQSGEVFSLSATGTKGNSIVSGTFAYGMNISPDDELYLSLAGDFTGNGYVATYRLNGTFQDSVLVGIAPNGVYFD